MRILLICGSYPPVKCGVGDYTALLAAELVAMPQLVVGVLTSSGADSSRVPAGVELLPHPDSWGVDQLAKISGLISNWQPDIVHIQYPSKGYGKGKGPVLLPLLLGRQKIPIVQTWHEPLGWLRSLRYLPAALTRDALIVVEPQYGAFIPCWLDKILQRKRIFRYIPVGSNIPYRIPETNERLGIRAEYGAEQHNLVVFFGFVAPPKGVDAIFKIADPATDRILLICDLDGDDPYQKKILELVESEDWRGKSFYTGFKAAEEVACMLAVADIAVFPFQAGVTGRNASVLAARNQGTFVVTTSVAQHGYVESENSYYATPGNLEDMSAAVRRYSGQRGAAGKTPDWPTIAAAHVELYKEILTKNS